MSALINLGFYLLSAKWIGFEFICFIERLWIWLDLIYWARIWLWLIIQLWALGLGFDSLSAD